MVAFSLGNAGVDRDLHLLSALVPLRRITQTSIVREPDGEFAQPWDKPKD